MPLTLDHVVIAIDDLDAAIDDYRALGFTVRRGGVHANRATHNALVTFADGTYLELLAATGALPLPGLVDFGVMLRQGEGLAGFALASNDLDADAVRLRAHGVAVGDVIPGERRREDGTLIRWKLALIDGGFAPFLIQDVTPRAWRVASDPAAITHANRVRGARAVEIAMRDPAAAWNRYAVLFGSAPPFDADTNHAAGCVLLRDDARAADHETLFALHLVCDDRHDDDFSPDRTHGVQFLAGPPP